MPKLELKTANFTVDVGDDVVINCNVYIEKSGH